MRKLRWLSVFCIVLSVFVVNSTKAQILIAQYIPFAFFKAAATSPLTPPGFVGISDDEPTSGTTFVLSKPAGLAVDDFMIVWIDNQSNIVDPPAGWDRISYEVVSGYYNHVYIKFADSSDVAASDFTFTSQGTITDAYSILVAYSGVSFAAPVGFITVQSDTSGSVTFHGGTTVKSNSTMVAVGSTTGVAPGNPTGYTSRLSGSWNTRLSDKTESSPTTISNFTVSGGVPYVTNLIALNPRDPSEPYLAPTDCPSGYIGIAPDGIYTTEGFCVMKYEAKAQSNDGTSYDADGQGVALGSYKPASVLANIPWRDVNRDNSRTECQSLGSGYDLVSNAQWQTIARNIELQGSNWSGGYVGNGCIWNGNGGDLDCGFDDSNPASSSTNSRGILALSDGETIHDLAANVAEWVLDDNSTNYGSSGYWPNIDDNSHSTTGTLADGVARTAKQQFGPLGIYSTSNDYSGLGNAQINSTAGGVARSGNYSAGSWAGPFGIFLSDPITYTGGDHGFRCVYTPANDTCADGTAALGDTCAGGTIYAGQFDGGHYMITPGDCTDSATPYCDGTTDTLNKTWRGSSGTDVDISGVETVVANATASSSSYRGHVNTPAIVSDASISSDSAADFCEDMVYGGYDDWYLPSKSELAYIYCKSNVPSHNSSHPHEDPNCVSNGGKTSDLQGFASDYYWTSTEYSNDDAWSESFTDGDQADNDPKSGSRKVRCVRRFYLAGNDVTPNTVNWDDFSGASSIETFWGIDTPITLDVAAANGTGAPTFQYKKNNEAWTTFTTLTSGTVIITEGDTLQFQVLGTEFDTGTITVTNTSDNNSIIDAVVGTVSNDPCDGSPALGTSCSGGAIYAGYFDSGHYMITPGDCTDSSTPVCDGTTDTLTKAWRGSMGTNSTDIVGVESIASNNIKSSSNLRGHVTSPVIAADPGVSSDSAADYCEDMIFGGYSDWHLPSKSEMAYIYCKSNAPSHNSSNPQEDPNCVEYGGKTSDLTNFNTGTQYWTSAESFGLPSWAFLQNFNNGDQSIGPKSTSLSVRCIRRYNATTSSSLIHHWKFDETSGTTAVNSVGTVDGSLVNGASWVPSGGVFGGAVNVDGVDDAITFAGNAGDFSTYPLTYSFWYNPDELPGTKGAGWPRLIRLNGDVDPPIEIEVGWGDDVLDLDFYNEIDTEYFHSGDAALVERRWNHIAFTVDGAGDSILYIDGVQNDTTESMGSLMTGNGDLNFGAYGPGSDVSDGKLDDLRIYSGALTAGEISDLYYEGLKAQAQEFAPAPADCPVGYVGIPADGVYTTESFCVMKYEAKAETNAGGSYDVDGLSVTLADYKPASISSNLPWRSINRNEAQAECQSLGTGYNLISNAQWQTVAQNLELQDANWSGGSVGDGCLKQGNNNEAICGYNGADPVAYSTDAKGIFTLSTGATIYDFAGNIYEMTRDTNGTNYGTDGYWSTINDSNHATTGTLDDGVTRSAKGQFGPIGTYSTTNNHSGLGAAWINYNAGMVIRGGGWNTNEAGIFLTDLDNATTYTASDVGFRCVYEGGGDPYASNVVLLLQPEEDDTSIVDYSASAHTVTPANGTALSTSVADPWGGNGQVIVFDGNDNRLSMPDSDDWFVNQDYTAEMWTYFTSDISNDDFELFWQTGGGTWTGMYIYNTADEGIGYENNSLTPTSFTQGSDNTASLNAWHHFAFTREGNTYRMFQDGVEIASGTTSSIPNNSTGPMHIGSDGMTTGWTINGYVGPVRFTRGVARYVEDFAPPAQPFQVGFTPELGGDGLLARYYFDEATSGTTPTDLIDHAPNPLHVPISYDGGNLVYSNTSTGAGWDIAAIASAGGAELTNIDSNKIGTAINGTKTFTFEAVADFEDCMASHSRIMWIGTGSQNGQLSFACHDVTGTGRFRIYYNDAHMEENSGTDLYTLGRSVYHIVVDTNLANNNVRYYRNGTLLGTDTIVQNTTVTVNVGDSWWVANRGSGGGRSFDGQFYYGALYDTALSFDQVNANVDILLANDDAPSNVDACDGYPAIGTSCFGGPIYAGVFDGGKYMITPGNCTDSATPTCDGTTDTLNKVWRGSTGSNVDIAGLVNIAGDSTPSSSNHRGYYNTPIIVADASISPDSAADYCNDMSYGGYTDWYLPSKSEMAYIYCHADISGGSHNTSYPQEDVNCASQGGKGTELPGFANSAYSTSSEASSSQAYMQSFASGNQFSINKSNTTRKIRCVRRYAEVGSDTTPDYMNWADFTATSDTLTFSGIDTNILLDISAANGTGAPTFQYSKNGGSWTTFTTISSASVSFQDGDTLAFQVSGTAFDTGTITVTNTDDDNTIIDTVLGTVPVDPCDGSPALGSTCTGGAIYAGVFDGGKYMITPGDCTNSANPTCDATTDTLQKRWRGTSGSSADLSIENITDRTIPSSSAYRGHVTTPVIVAAPSIDSDSAADYCNDMVYGGYDDWYLPSKSEMAYIYCHASVASHDTDYPHEDPDCTNYGGKTSDLADFANGVYWTSTEDSSSDARTQHFTTGWQGGTTKADNYYVRCVRRYGASPTTGLIHHYTLDETSGTTAADSVGSADGTLISGPVWTPAGGVLNGALEFDGVNDEISIPHANQFNTIPFTISLWVKVDTLPSANKFTLAGKKDSNSPWWVWSLDFDDTSDELIFHVINNGGGWHSAFSNISRNAGQWYHVVGTVDASLNVKLYVDGTLQSNTPTASDINTGDGDLYIGSGGGADYTDGLIDDVRFYNVDLSASEVSDLYNEGLNEPAKNFFVMTSQTFDGDLGGLSGADDKCLNDLQTHDWKGKAGVALNSTTVKAFLCDSDGAGSCNDPPANTTFAFARSGSTTAGGSTFTTDSTGRGPGDSANWSGSTYFDSTNYYWTNRRNDSGTLWNDEGDWNHCNGWTDNTVGFSGEHGDPNTTNQNRWTDGSWVCTDPFRLVCMVTDNGTTASNEDPYADSVVLLIQPDTDDTSTVDYSASAHSVTEEFDAGVSTAITDPWGGSNKLVAFDGASDRLLIADSDDFYLSGDFTIELWAYLSNLTGSSQDTFVQQWQNGSTNLDLNIDNLNNLGVFSGYNSSLFVDEGADNTSTDSQWSHIAYVRSGNDFYVFVDGTAVDTATNAISLSNISAPLWIGNDGGGGWDLDGYLTGLRMTKGAARYTDTFTPPDAPFADPRISTEFNGSDEELTRTPGSAGNRKTWTFSTWFKRDAAGNYETFYNANGVHLQIGSNNRIEWWDFGTAADNVLSSTLTITDTNWHHIVFALDTTQSTATDRAKVYLDGAEVTAFNTDNRSQLTQNSDRELNSTISHRIGMNQYTEIFDGLLSETYFVDGQALTGDDFGFDNSGTWSAKPYSGSYGTNGFYLFSKFKTDDGMGEDLSGNGNDYSTVNMDDSNFNGAGPP